jgi:phosphoglycolate phosphatase-like HAD superfamily hydrolase
MDWCVGPPLRTVFERLLNSNEPELIEKAHATHANHYARDGVFKARVFDGVIEMFGRLYERDLRLFVVTSRLALTAQRMVRTLVSTSSFIVQLVLNRKAALPKRPGRSLSRYVARICLWPRALWSATASMI